jgi:hypothetical protein
MSDLLPIIPPGGWSPPQQPSTLNRKLLIVGGLAVVGVGYLYWTNRKKSPVLTGTPNCTESHAGNGFRATCWGDKGTATGWIESGLVKPCGMFRKTNLKGRVEDESKQCFWKRGEAEEFVRGLVGNADVA